MTAARGDIQTSCSRAQRGTVQPSEAGAARVPGLPGKMAGNAEASACCRQPDACLIKAESAADVRAVPKAACFQQFSPACNHAEAGSTDEDVEIAAPDATCQRLLGAVPLELFGSTANGTAPCTAARSNLPDLRQPGAAKELALPMNINPISSGTEERSALADASCPSSSEPCCIDQPHATGIMNACTQAGVAMLEDEAETAPACAVTRPPTAEQHTQALQGAEVCAEGYLPTDGGTSAGPDALCILPVDRPDAELPSNTESTPHTPASDSDPPQENARFCRDCGATETSRWRSGPEGEAQFMLQHNTCWWPCLHSRSC